jgi:hypothetical protein
MRRRTSRPAPRLSPALSLDLSPVLVLLLACAAAAGCVPIIAHGPVVEPGGSMAFTAAGHAGRPFLLECSHTATAAGPSAPLVYGRECPGVRALFGPGSYTAVRWGRAATTAGGVAYSVGVQAPGGFDVYAQLPGRAGGLDRGAGLLFSLLHVSPYVQVGRSDGERGWHTTQLLWVVNPVEIEKDYITPGVHWVPSVSYRLAPRKGGGMTVHVAGNVGAERERHRQDGARPLVATWGATAAVTVEPWRRPVTP